MLWKIVSDLNNDNAIGERGDLNYCNPVHSILFLYHF